MAVLAAEHPRVRVAGAEVSVDHYIGGRRVASAATFEDRSPLDWSLLAEVVARRCRDRGGRGRRGRRGVPRVGRARRRGSRRPSPAAGRSDRRERRAHRAGRVPRHGDARGVAAPARDPARRPQLPRLRGAGGGLRGARVGVERHAQPRRAHAERARGRDHSVERALHALDLEDGARARRRLHRRAQAGRVVAALVLAAGRSRRRGRSAAGRLQHRAGHRRGGRRGARRRPARAADLVHGLARDRASHRRGRRGATSSRSPPSWAARAR